MSNWFGGVAGGRDSAFHVEYDTSLGGLTLSHNSYFGTITGIVQVMDWGDGSPLEVWDTVGYDWRTFSLIHTYATSGTYRVKTWWVPKDSTQNPPSNIYGYTFGHPKNGRWDWMGNDASSYNSRIGITELINFGPSSPSFLADDYLAHNNLSMTYLQDGIKEDLDTRYQAYRWASGCKLKNTYNPKVWAMFDTRKLISMSQFFDNASNQNSGLNFNPDITMWDVGSVETFSEMFFRLDGFDQDLSNWDVSSANNMSNMFRFCYSFNNGGATGIGNWNTSNVTTMLRMFSEATSFNQPIGNWNTSNVTSMQNMFNNASSFNQDLSNWNTSNVTSMNGMFGNALAFNNGGATGIDDWNTSNVTNMGGLFYNADAFNQPIGNWDVSNVTNMSEMFSGNLSFNNGGATGIDDWDVSSVTRMDGMFNNADAFNQPIGNWDVSSVTRMDYMVANTALFNQPIGNWNTSNVTNMGNMFQNAIAFNQPIGNWDVSNVTNMYMMFQSTPFNQDLSNWDVSSVTTMRRMFRFSNFSNGGATGISDWDVSNVIRFSEMFRGCYTFDADLSTPTWQAGISFATTNNDYWAINYMFWDCRSFNNGGSTGISDWDVSGCSRLDYMFINALVFNHDLSRWDVSSANNMVSMFSNATSFNNGGATGIDDWDVSNVTDMNSMFNNADAFNQPIGNWDVSNVTNMQVMFQEANVFNQDIGGWDTSSVSNFYRAFRRAYAFDQDLGNWSLASATNVNGFYDGTSSMSDENYSRLLVGWANFVYDNNGPYNLTLYSNTTQYTNALTPYPGYGSEEFTTAPAARAYLTGATAGWTITDAGQA